LKSITEGTFPNRENPGLELILDDADQLDIRLMHEPAPVGKVITQNGSVELSLRGPRGPFTRARSMSYVELDESCLGKRIRYHWDDLLSDGLDGTL
jgi:hypothetical protein